MRLQITLPDKTDKEIEKMRSSLINKGFLTMEIMLAFSLMILFTISTFTLSSSMQKLKQWSLVELDKLKLSVKKMDELVKNRFADISRYEVIAYGNDTKRIYIDPLIINHSDYETAWGRDSCDPRLDFNENNIKYFKYGIDIGTGNASTDIEVRNGIIYLVADSSSSAQKDFFIIDDRDFSTPSILSSLNTGPGISAIEVAGSYVFVAQASSLNQLQVIDIRNRNDPHLISQIKLPLPTPTTTAPFAKSIFYSKGFIYLGTAKWNGSEFSIIDVSNPYDPRVIGTFETNTLINDIYVRDDRAYLASADEMQMRILDISDKSNPMLIDSFSSSGWQTQEGKTLEYFEGSLGLGRTVGGFNVATNHEAFIFSTSSNIVNFMSKDIPGGIYGILLRKPYVFLLTHSLNHEFQVWDFVLQNKIYDIPLESQPVKMVCDGSNIFFATLNNKGFSVLKLYE